LLTERDRALAVYNVGSLNQILGFVYFPARAATIALGLFGILAVMLAATGIYGMASYSVSRRRREIGIRVAIGATAPRILRLVLARISVLLLAGSTAGFLLGLTAGPLLARVVYQAPRYDPTIMLTVPV
jgi:ABC-type antimicrobial peptide transport system permease subunit